MPALKHETLSLDAFLVWEAGQQERRHELVGGVVRMMTGGTVAHERVKSNVQFALRQRLRSGPCTSNSFDMKIVCGNGNVRYPDVTVDCGPFRPSDVLLRDPRVVVEVLSPGSRTQDLVFKVRDYGATPSITAYVVLWPDEALAVVHRRSGEAWALPEETRGLGAVIALPEIGTDLPLAEAYEGLDLDADGEGAA